jgi:hypothetical protein
MTPRNPGMRELPLALPLRPWGIMARIYRCRNATRSAVHKSGDTEITGNVKWARAEEHKFVVYFRDRNVSVCAYF